MVWLSSTFSWSLLWGLLLGCSVEAIPDTNEKGFASGSRIQSTDWFPSSVTGKQMQFKTTDEICAWFWEAWQERVKMVTRPGGSTRVRPLVWSKRAVVNMNEHGIHFSCSDSRDQRSITSIAWKLDSPRPEVKTMGPYVLLCDRATEIPRVWKQYFDIHPSPNANYRNIGACEAKEGSSSSQSVAITAGATECLDIALNGKMSSIAAYLEDDDDYDDFQQPDPINEWMSITESSTRREVFVRGQRHISMPVDKLHTSSYRACAKQGLGHGNARLFLSATELLKS